MLVRDDQLFKKIETVLISFIKSVLKIKHWQMYVSMYKRALFFHVLNNFIIKYFNII